MFLLKVALPASNNYSMEYLDIIGYKTLGQQYNLYLESEMSSD